MERSEKKIGHDERMANEWNGNGTVTVQERKYYCKIK